MSIPGQHSVPLLLPVCRFSRVPLKFANLSGPQRNMISTARHGGRNPVHPVSFLAAILFDSHGALALAACNRYVPRL